MSEYDEVETVENEDRPANTGRSSISGPSAPAP